MVDENELLIRASLVDELSAGVDVIDAQVKKLTRDIALLNAEGAKSEGSAGVGLLERVVGRLKTTVNGADGALRSASSFLGGAFATAAKVALGGVAALGAGMVLLGVQATSNLETARVGIETFVGSVSKGDALFAQIKQMQGPFTVPGLQAAAQAMLVAGTGADHLIPRLKTLTDIAATQADPNGALTSLADAVGRIQEMGVLDTRTLRPLLTAGVPVYEMLSSELGVPVDQLRKTLATGAPIDLPMRFFADLEAETGPLARFKGAIDTQRETIKGQFQQVKVTAQNALADIFQPVADSLKPVMTTVRSNLDSLIRGIGPQFTIFLTGVVGLIGGVLPLLQPVAASLLGAFGTVLTALVPALAQLAPQMPALATAFADLLIAFIPLIPPLTNLTVALVPVLVLGITKLTTVVTDLVKWVTPVIDKVADWVNGSSALRTVLADLLVVILGYRVLTTVGGWIGGLVTKVRDLTTATKAAKTEGCLTDAICAGEGSAGEIAGTTGAVSSLTTALGEFAIAAAPVFAMVGLGGYIDRIQNGPPTSSATLAAENRDVGPMIAAGNASYLKTGIAPDLFGNRGVPYAAGVNDESSLGGATNVQYDPAGAAAAAASMAAQGWRQNPDTGALEPITPAGQGGPALVVQGPLVHADNLHSTADVQAAFGLALTEAERQKRERN